MNDFSLIYAELQAEIEKDLLEFIQIHAALIGIASKGREIHPYGSELYDRYQRSIDDDQEAIERYYTEIHDARGKIKAAEGV